MKGRKKRGGKGKKTGENAPPNPSPLLVSPGIGGGKVGAMAKKKKK